MRLPVVYKPQARRDLVEIADWYEQQGGAALAERFLAEARRAVDFLAENPMAGPKRDFGIRRYLGMRRWRLRCFPQAVFYQIADGCIDVIRIVHGARNQRAAFRK